MRNCILLIVLFFCFASSLTAKVTLPALVGDNMVLQQQSDVKIWGWSKPNASIDVKTSWGARGATISDNQGNWVLTIATPASSFTQHTITVSDGEPITINNVLVAKFGFAQVNLIWR